MYLLFGSIFAVIGGFMGAWGAGFVFGGFVLGFGGSALVNAIATDNTPGTDSSHLGGCLLYAILAGILEGL